MSLSGDNSPEHQVWPDPPLDRLNLGGPPLKSYYLKPYKIPDQMYSEKKKKSRLAEGEGFAPFHRPNVMRSNISHLKKDKKKRDGSKSVESNTGSA